MVYPLSRKIKLELLDLAIIPDKKQLEIVLKTQHEAKRSKTTVDEGLFHLFSLDSGCGINIDTLPYIGLADVFPHLEIACGWSEGRLRRFKYH